MTEEERTQLQNAMAAGGNVQDAVNRMFLYENGFHSVGLKPSYFEHHLIRCFMLANADNLYLLTSAYPLFGRAFADFNSGKLEQDYGV